MIFLAISHVVLPSSTSQHNFLSSSSLFSSAGELGWFSGDGGPIFRRRELLLKVGGSFSSSFCDFFMLQLYFSSSFPSSCSSSASHLRADSGEFWTAAGSSEAPSCVLELRKLDLCLL